MSPRTKMILRVTLLMFVTMLFAVPAFAANDPGVKANNWLQTNVGALIPGILLVVSLIFFFTRDWMKLLSFVGITIVVAMLLNWEEVKKLANSLYSAVFG